jgi:hypothetical protein
MCIESVSAPAILLVVHPNLIWPWVQLLMLTDPDPDGSRQGLDNDNDTMLCVGYKPHQSRLYFQLNVYKVFQQLLLCSRGIMVVVRPSL